MPIFFAVLRGPSHLLKNRVIIPKPVSVVGSALDADIPFPEIQGLAELHAKVYLDGKDLIVESLNHNPVSVKNAQVEVVYLDENDRVLEKKNLNFTNIPAKGSLTLRAPDQKWADHVDYSLVAFR